MYFEICSGKLVLWKKVVLAKHGVQSHWCAKISSAPHGVGFWKNEIKLWNEFSFLPFSRKNTLLDVFYQNCRFLSRQWDKHQGWKDRWLGNSVLQIEYPNLFQYLQQPKSRESYKAEKTILGIHYSNGMCRIGSLMNYSTYLKDLGTAQSINKYQMDLAVVIKLTGYTL